MQSQPHYNNQSHNIPMELDKYVGEELVNGKGTKNVCILGC